MIETRRDDLEAAFYGVLRLVAGWQDWKAVEDLPNNVKVKNLLGITTTAFNALNADVLNADPKQHKQVLRKLQAYQQLALLEKFMFSEVIWDD
jgi:hypothetical protein